MFLQINPHSSGEGTQSSIGANCSWEMPEIGRTTVPASASKRLSESGSAGSVPLACWTLVALLTLFPATFPGCPSSTREEDVSLAFAQSPPSFSPDDLVVLFMSPMTGNGDIYRVNVDGTGCARLTSGEAIESHPVFSPKGDLIAYLSQPPDDSESRHLWIMDADGGHSRQVTYGDYYEYRITGFSDDGKQIYFERIIQLAQNTVDHVPLVFPLDGLGMAVDRRGQGQTHSKLRSPDGRFALELVDPGRSVPWREIWIKDLQAGERRFLTNGVGPVFSKDGSRVIFWTEASPNGGQLGMVNVDGTDRRTLGLPTDSTSPLGFSHDGRHLAVTFARSKGESPARSFGVSIVDLGDGSVRMNADSATLPPNRGAARP